LISDPARASRHGLFEGKEVMMTSLPDRPNLRQIRGQAKELKRALVEGDQDALARVLAAHPKFAGQPPERLQGWGFTLRDAQVTIARELGFASWGSLVSTIDDSLPVWDSRSSAQLSQRAFKEARSLKHRYCHVSHFLLALLNPPEPTEAAAVLNQLGLTYDQVKREVSSWEKKSRPSLGVVSAPSYQLILGWSQGIAIGMGQRFSDEHSLLALAFGDLGGEPILTWYDVDPADVVELLRDRGVEVPRLKPPALQVPIGPQGPFVYFPAEYFSHVTHELSRHYPPGTSHWGTNRSKWKRGFWYLVGEDDIPMEEIVRRALSGSAGQVEVLTFVEGATLEHANAPRRYRAQGEEP
jgi:hypothetical protein